MKWALAIAAVAGFFGWKYLDAQQRKTASEAVKQREAAQAAQEQELRAREADAARPGVLEHEPEVRVSTPGTVTVSALIEGPEAMVR